MKRTILNLLFFACSFAVVYTGIFAILFFIQPNQIPMVYRVMQGAIWEGGNTWLKMQQFDEHKKWDIIVIGSSHAYRGYDPEIFKKHGYSMYNLGTSSQDPVCSYFLTEDLLDSINCSMLIIDFYDRVFGCDDMEPKSDLIQNTKYDKTALKIAKATSDIRAVNMLTLRFFNKFKEPLNTDTTGFTNGFQVSKKFLSPLNKDKDKTGWKYTRNEKQVQHFDKLLALCKKRNIKTVVVSHPLSELYALKDHKECVKSIEPLLHKHNISYLDYTELEEMSGIIWYADASHLNHLGVPKFNEILIRDLIKNNFLPERQQRHE